MPRQQDPTASPQLATILEDLRRVLPMLQERYGVSSLGVFGSYVHQRQNPASDLDLLVTFDCIPGLLKYLELEHYLSDTLGVKVDLVMKDALKENIGKRILSEVIPL